MNKNIASSSKWTFNYLKKLNDFHHNYNCISWPFSSFSSGMLLLMLILPTKRNKGSLKKHIRSKLGHFPTPPWVPPVPSKVGTHIRKLEIFYYFIVCSKPFWTRYFFSWDTYVKADFRMFFLHGQRSVAEPGPTPSPWSIEPFCCTGYGALKSPGK